MFKESFSFDDVLLIPKFSDVRSRAEVDLSVKLAKNFEFKFPVCPSNMLTISELKMVKLMYQNKNLAIFHRFTEFENQLNWLKEIKNWGEDTVNYIGFSIGVKEDDYNYVKELIANGAKIICIDVAHGDSTNCIEMTKFVATNFPNVLLISGNVATGEGAERIWQAGADIVKINVGSGSICTTRVQTGNGIPAITSLTDCYESKKYMEVKLGRKLFMMQDGGCKSPGDVVKALCFADMVMAGNLFAGSSETPGEIIEKDGKKYKSYVGSSTHRGNYSEGVKAMVEYKGDTSAVVQSISEGVRSGLSYQGVRNLTDLRKNPRFVKITAAGFKESNAHDVVIQ